MDINNRIKYLRKSLSLTQAGFGKEIGLGNSAISAMEKAGAAVTEQTIKSICQSFGVSESWLREGQGDMFSDCDYTTNLLNDMRIHYHLTIADEKLLRGYLQLDERERKVITDFIKKSADEIKTAESSINEKVEAYRRQLLAQAEE